MSEPTRREALAMLALAAGCAGAEPRARAPLFTEFGLACGDDEVALARAVGFDFLTIGVSRHLIPAKSDAEFESRLARSAELPLPVRCCNVFLPGTLRVTGPAADHDAIVRYASAVFARAARAGVRRIVFGSSSARRAPAGFPLQEARAQLAALLRRLAPLAQQARLTLMPENLNRGEDNLLNRVGELVEIVAAIDHPCVRINADLYHMARESEDPQALAAAARWIAQIEIAEKERRTVPGTAGDDFRPYFRALAGAGWSGPLNVEAANATEDGYRRMFSVLHAQIREVS